MSDLPGAIAQDCSCLRSAVSDTGSAVQCPLQDKIEKFRPPNGDALGGGVERGVMSQRSELQRAQGGGRCASNQAETHRRLRAPTQPEHHLREKAAAMLVELPP